MEKFKVGDKVEIIAGPKQGKRGKVETVAFGPMGGVMYHILLDEGYLTDAAERNLKLANSRVSNARFKVGDKVYFYGRPATVKQVIREPDADYILDVQGDDFYAEDDEVTSRNSRAANAIYQGSRVKYVGDDPRWKGMTGIVLRVKDNSEDNRENYYWVDFPGRPSLPESDLVANSRVCNVEPEPRVDGYGQEWYIRLKDGQVWRKRGTKEQMERLGKWLADRIGTQVEFIQPTGLNSRVCNSSNPVVRKAMNAAGQGTDIGNTLVKEYRNYARSQIQDLIQKVGDAQSYLSQQSERLKDRAAERGTDKDSEVIFVTHRKVDAALDAITAQLRRVLGY